MGQIKNTELLKKVGKRIKELREKKGITQEVFYYDTNINPSRVEAGEYNFTVSTIDAICKYLEISLEEFFSQI